MKIKEGVHNLIFLDFEEMFDYLTFYLEDRLIEALDQHPEFTIDTNLYIGENEIYTIQIVIDRYRHNNTFNEF